MNSDLTQKFLEGKCSSEEVKKVIQWYNSENSDFLLAHEIEKYWNESPRAPGIKLENKNEVYKNIQKLIAESEPKEVQIAHYNDKKKVLGRFLILKVAASLLILMMVGFFLYQQRLNNEILVVQTQPDNHFTIKSNPKGQKSTITLSDGSKVRLNSSSEIRFESDFSDSRLVYLSGEAFFEVVADPERPFTVISNNLATIAVGTSFNVQAYPDEKEIKVSLSTGKVKIRQNNEWDNSDNFELYLEPGYQAVFNTAKNTIRKAEFDQRKILSWKDNILYFDDAEFEEVIKQLEMWYGVSIQVENEIYEDKLYTGEFKESSLQNVLESLSFTKDFQFTLNGQDVHIKFN